MMSRYAFRHAAVLGATLILLVASGCRHKYANPIAKDTQQPDKILFDTSIDDIEKGRFERARLTLQTLMNTYDTSEYLAKAKLAVADSWLREGGAHGFAQAEAEYRDFILFYPNMEESAEAAFKICDMQYKQMDKADRDPAHAREANEDCKDVLEKYPNSKFAPPAAQHLREVQENLAESEMKVAEFYHQKGGRDFAPSANRLQALADQYPLYSRADDALWMLADDYLQMGDKYENRQADAYTRIVRDYPLSAHVDDAKAQLQALGHPIPDPDPVAYARMKYELENRSKRSLLSKVWGPFGSGPNLSRSAKSGTPEMQTFKPTIPLSIPATAAGATTQEVGISVVGNSDVIDKSPDARQAAAAGGDSGAAASAAGSSATGAAGTTGGGDQAASTASGTQSGASSASTGKKTTRPARKLKQVAAKPPKPPKLPKQPKSSKKGTAAQKGTTDTLPVPDKK